MVNYLSWSRDTPLLKEEERTEGLKSIPAWKLNEKSTEISRAFVAKNFLAAIDFFQRVAEIAEEANHHPDLHLTDYRNVKVRAVMAKSGFSSYLTEPVDSETDSEANIRSTSWCF